MHPRCSLVVQFVALRVVLRRGGALIAQPGRCLVAERRPAPVNEHRSRRTKPAGVSAPSATGCGRSSPRDLATGPWRTARLGGDPPGVPRPIAAARPEVLGEAAPRSTRRPQSPCQGGADETPRPGVSCPERPRCAGPPAQPSGRPRYQVATADGIPRDRHEGLSEPGFGAVERNVLIAGLSNHPTYARTKSSTVRSAALTPFNVSTSSPICTSTSLPLCRIVTFASKLSALI